MNRPPAPWRPRAPEASATSVDELLGAVRAAAEALVAAGVSVIPMDARERPKSPDFGLLTLTDAAGQARWGAYKVRLPRAAELDRWAGQGREFGLAAVCGAVSGGLECLDFEDFEVFEEWFAALGEVFPDLLHRLVVVRTPRPGRHVYFRSERCGPSTKLAMSADGAGTIVEVKGEGGYCLVPPSPPGCHPSNVAYAYAPGPTLADAPLVTEGERDAMLRLARAFDLRPPPVAAAPPPRRPGRAPAGARPGDDFAARVGWGEVLEPHGWAASGGGADGATYWSRPGKAGGTSATTGYAGTDLLHVFSSNAPPFEAGGSYGKFAAYALLEHGGDYAAAAAALRGRGFGGSSPEL